MQTSYPYFESGQVLTSTHLNDLSAYLEEQDRLTRNRLIGIGIVCGLDVAFEPPGRVNISQGCAITSAGYLMYLPDTDYDRYRPYTIPVPQLKEIPAELKEDAYPFFPTRENNQNGLWELIPEGAEVVGEPNPSPLDQGFLADKVALLFLERNLESLKNCDINDCSDSGIEREFVVRALLVSKDDAEKMLEVEQEIVDEEIEGPGRVIHRHEHPRYKLKELDLPKINPSGFQIGSYQQLFDRISDITADVGPRLHTALQDSYTAFGYLLTTIYPTDMFPDGPFSVGLYLERAIAQTKATSFMVQYLYAYLHDLVAAYNEFLRAVMRLDAVCCPIQERFPAHILLGEVLVPPRAVLPQLIIPTLGFLRGNDQQAGATTHPAPYRHHFVPSPLFNHEKDRLAEVQSLHYRLYLQAYHFSIRNLLERNIRITPSKDGDVPLSGKAIPFYYSLVANSEKDALARNWSYSKTTRNHLDRLFAYPYISERNHPLFNRHDAHNFYRVEGMVGKGLGTVMRNLATQKRTKGLAFAVQPVYLEFAVQARRLDSERELVSRNRVEQTLRPLALCRLRELDAIFLGIMQALFEYVSGIIAVLARLDTSVVGGDRPAGGEGNGNGNGNGGGIVGVRPFFPGRFIDPNLLTTTALNISGGLRLARRSRASTINEFRPIIYTPGLLTSRNTTSEDPKTSVGALFGEMLSVSITRDLIDRLDVVIPGLDLGVPDREAARRLYPIVSLLEKSEELTGVLTAASLAEFNFAEFEKRYDSFALAFQKLIAAATEEEDPQATLRLAAQGISERFGTIAATAPQAVLAGLMDQIEAQVQRLFAELRLEAYSQKHPGLEHKGGVPVGGTLVLLFTHRRFFVESVDEIRETFSNRYDELIRRVVGRLTEAVEIPAVGELIRAGQVDDPLDDFVVIGDFCLPYHCCEGDCSDMLLREQPDRPAEVAIVSGNVLAFANDEEPRPIPAVEVAIEIVNIETGEGSAVEFQEDGYAFSVPAGAYRLLVKGGDNLSTIERIITVLPGETSTEDFVLRK